MHFLLPGASAGKGNPELPLEVMRGWGGGLQDHSLGFGALLGLTGLSRSSAAH